jgi:hypothetical protein
VTFDPIRKVCLAETIAETIAAMPQRGCGQSWKRRKLMTAAGGGLRLLSDSDVDALAWQVLDSEYAGDVYAQYHSINASAICSGASGLVRVADDGDLHNIILDRIMSGINSRPGKANRSPAAVRPT